MINKFEGRLGTWRGGANIEAKNSAEQAHDLELWWVLQDQA